MTTNYWKPSAVPQTQTYTYVVNTYDANDDYGLLLQDPDNTDQQFTINCTTSSEIGSATNDIIVTLLAKFKAATHPVKDLFEVAAIGTSGSYTGLTISAATSGIPILVTSTDNPTGNTTLTQTIANVSPYDPGNADNWSLGHIPATGEDIEFNSYTQGPQVNVLALDDIELATATFLMGHTGLVGTAKTALALKLTGKLTIGESTLADSSAGSGRLNIKLVNANGEAEILNSCRTPADEGLATIRLEMSGATAKLRVRKANMRLICNGTIGTVETSIISNNSDVTMTIDPTCTTTTFTMQGGNVIHKGAYGTATIYAGNFEHVGSAAGGPVVIGQTAMAYLSSGGNITSISCSGKLNMRMNRKTRSVGVMTLFKGFEVAIDYDVVAFTNGIRFDGCKVSDGVFDIGENYLLTPAV